MEDIPAVEVRPITIGRLQKLITKYYGREYTEAAREGYVYVQDDVRYMVFADQTTDQDAPYHLKVSQAFRESGTFCPLYILLSVLAYRKEIPKGRYLLRVRE